jgi:GNAT superfamily N-acetyltransferase
MSSVQLRDMDKTSEYFVGTCSHVNESEEIDAGAQRRLNWLRRMHKKGLRVKVAFLDDKPSGFLYVMPIEICPWGPLGKDLLAIPCLWVVNKVKGKGVGSSLIVEAEKEAQYQGKKGIVTIGYYHDFWFMPASFFEHLGFSVAKRKTTKPGGLFADYAILWKVYNSSAEVPRFFEQNCQFKPINDKVVVDLFFNTFCQTSNIEAQRIREVVAEFGEKVVLNEYPAEDPEVLHHYQIDRGIFINGKEIGWGYEAPKEGIREAISKALDS